jgi:flagellar protein FlaF
MQHQGTDAYRHARQKTAAPRELEAGLLLAAAAHLQSIAAMDLENVNPAHCSNFARAMTFNCKIWTILVTCAMRTDSQLPQTIRQSIAELGLFVISRTARVLKDRSGRTAGEAIPVLVEINRSVASGLKI